MTEFTLFVNVNTPALVKYFSMVAPCWCRALFLKRWPCWQTCFCHKDEQQITQWQILLKTRFSTGAPKDFFDNCLRKQIFPRDFKSSKKVKNLWTTVPFVWDIRSFSTNLPTILEVLFSHSISKTLLFLLKKGLLDISVYSKDKTSHGIFY